MHNLVPVPFFINNVFIKNPAKGFAEAICCLQKKKVNYDSFSTFHYFNIELCQFSDISYGFFSV